MADLITQLKRKSYELRMMMLQMCIQAGTGHTTSSLSCIDILVTLYYGQILRFDANKPQWEERDRLICSKGQASPGLYVCLADLGFFPREDLASFAQEGGKFGVHLQKDVPGVELTVGSLGQGFGVAAGIAMGARMNRMDYLVFALLGDGECYEGSIWETAMFAGHNRLNNLVAIIDRNYMCVTDFTENLAKLEPFEAKWASFGWDVARVDGHSFEEMLQVFHPLRSRRSSRPLIVIADTVKGQGVECMSNIPLWHGRAPEGEFAQMCLRELKRRYSVDHE